ncbi:hypothetical protein MKX01_039440 [Papaver californicum]|nr:hypothetical protein MKX01_039440 [Papaver californicum]
MRGRTNEVQKRRLITSLCLVGIVVCFVFVYYGTFFVSRVQRGTSTLRRLGSPYLGGNEEADSKQNESSTALVQEDGESDIALKSFPVCDDRHSELIPCLDRHLIYQLRLKLDLRYNCLIPPPPDYKVPIKWPRSRDEVWKANIPHTHLASEKSDQNWMVVRGEKIVFPGGGTHFHYGADKYIASLANMLNFSNNNISSEGRIRTVLDVGFGVAIFGAYLLSSEVIAMSLAPNDVHQNQIQFALERGIPAYLGVLGTKRLPYPSRSFELAHCSRCRIDWLQRDGLLLLELDRLLRPGEFGKKMSALVERMCWKIAAKQNQTVIWDKPLTNDCYMERKPGTQPPLCRSDDDPDAVWGVPMEACITPYSEQSHISRGSGLAPWPRLADFGYSSEAFEKDTPQGRDLLESLESKNEAGFFKKLDGYETNMGYFAAALKEKDVWVMNVVPEDGANTLKLIYDRGLIGTVHSCIICCSTGVKHSQPTLEPSYDLLHAWTVLSDIDRKGCSIEDLLLEMDRLLRPTGFIIIRDKRPLVESIKKYLPALRWEAVATADGQSDSDQDKDEVVFVIQKTLWLTNDNLRDSE